MKYLLVFLAQLIFVNTFSQYPQVIDSVYINELQNSIQKNVGEKYVKFIKKSLAGKQYSEKGLLGKVILVNFWFESCSPCIAEFEALNKLYQRYKGNKKFQFISFTIDTPKRAKLTAQKYNLKFPIICISEKECRQLNYKSGFPTNIIIDTAGKISSIKIGGSIEKQIVATNIKDIEYEIEKCLSN